MQTDLFAAVREAARRVGAALVELLAAVVKVMRVIFERAFPAPTRNPAPAVRPPVSIWQAPLSMRAVPIGHRDFKPENMSRRREHRHHLRQGGWR